MSDLVGTPEDRFSHIMAHMNSCICGINLRKFYRFDRFTVRVMNMVILLYTFIMQQVSLTKRENFLASYLLYDIPQFLISSLGRCFSCLTILLSIRAFGRCDDEYVYENHKI